MAPAEHEAAPGASLPPGTVPDSTKRQGGGSGGSLPRKHRRGPSEHPNVLIVGIVLLVVAGLIEVAAVVPQRIRVSYTIPSNVGSYGRWQIDVLTGGVVAGSFASFGGLAILYLFNPYQETEFLAGRYMGSFASVMASGNFSATLPAGGTYYLDVFHVAGPQQGGILASATISIAAVSTWITVWAVLVGAGGGAFVGAERLFTAKRARFRADSPPPGVMFSCPYCGAYRGLGARVCGMCGRPYPRPPTLRRGRFREPPKGVA